MNRLEYIKSMHHNLCILKEQGVFVNENYLCPLCMKAFSDDEVITCLSEEDVPQASLGGKRIALTCRKCNNTCGHTIDVNLLNGIIDLEQRQFLPSTDRKVNVLHDGKRLGAKLRVDSDRNMLLEINTKHNNPKIWDEYRSNVLQANAIVDVQDAPLKRKDRFVSAALLKNAYLILFARTGYTFLSDSFYDELRKQICNPNPYILPEGLWTMQNISATDGIYLSRDNMLRGFFIVYTLTKIQNHRVCVFLPCPVVPYLAATYRLKEMLADACLPVEELHPSSDFFNDKEDIGRLRKWCFGWDLSL